MPIPEIHIMREATIVVAASNSTTPSGDYVCDGTADEVEINLAIVALGASGGEVVLLDGTFTVATSITLASNVTLSGQGRNTIITTATDNIDIITATGGGGSELTHIILRDFLVRGFETGNKNDEGILWTFVDTSKIINVWIEHNGERGLHLVTCDNNEIENVHTFSNFLDGLMLDTCTFTKLINCISNVNTQRGMDILSSPDTDIVTPTCYNNDSGGATYSGIHIQSSDRSTVVGARCSTNGLHGLYIFRTDHCAVIGGEFNNQNTGDGINITGDGTDNSDYNMISGATCTANGDDGIAIEGGGDANNNVINFCQLLGNIGTALVDNGTGTELGWANIDEKSPVNLLINGDFEIGDPPIEWILEGVGATLARSNVQARINTYSALLTRNGNDCDIYQGISNFAYYDSRIMTVGVWVYATVADRARIGIGFNGAVYWSAFHTGDSTWQWLTRTYLIGVAPVNVRLYCQILSGDTAAYFDGAILVEGDSCPAFSPKPAAYITEKEFTINAFQYPTPGTDWTPTIQGAHLTVNKATKYVWLPLNFLKIGDYIVSYKIVGDMLKGGGDTVILDCKLVRVNLADPLTTSDVAGGGIVQVAVDGDFDVEAVLTAPELVATDKQYLLEILGSTSNVGGSEFITVIGAEVKLFRLG